MISIHADLFEVLRAVEIESPDAYTLCGKQRTVSRAETSAASSAAEPAPLESAIARDLYARLYFRPSEPNPRVLTDVLAWRDLLAALSAANTGRGTWEPGWTIHIPDEDGLVVAVKDDVAFWIPAGDVRV